MDQSTLRENVRERASAGGSQTLLRGLDVIEAVAGGPLLLSDLSTRLGLTQSTTHRLAMALVERGYLTALPRAGYRLGSKLLELGFRAQSQVDLVQVARPHMLDLADRTEDTVHLGVLENGKARYLDKIEGRRRINISSRVGDVQPLTSTGLGKALLLDHSSEDWTRMLSAERSLGPITVDPALWRSRMDGYVASGRAYDLEENEDRIRCVAAPIRGAGGRIIGAISVSGARQYMNDDRMIALSDMVLGTTEAISRDLGWSATERFQEKDD